MYAKRNITYDTSLVVTSFLTSTEVSCIVNDLSEVIPSRWVMAFFLFMVLMVLVVVSSLFSSLVNKSQMDFFGGLVTFIETDECLTATVERIVPAALCVVVQAVILDEQVVILDDWVL